MLVGDGALKQIRTADLLITNQLLYQLSYEGLCYMLQCALSKVEHNCEHKEEDCNQHNTYDGH